MYENIYGLSCIENQILAILKSRGQDITLLYHNCAIPIRKLFISMVILGQKPERFCEIPRIQETLKRRKIILLKRMQQDNILSVRSAIKKCKPDEYILMRTNPDFAKKVLHARGFRDDHYVLAKAVGNHFTVINDIPEKAVILEADQLGNAYGGDFFDLIIHRGLTKEDREFLWSSRIFKPEIDAAFSLCETELDGIPDPGFRLRDMTGIYKTLCYRMAAYYGHYVDTSFIRNVLPNIEQYYALFEYYNLKYGTSSEKYFALFGRLIQTDRNILSELTGRLAVLQEESTKAENRL